jgi:ribonucleotide monophosphatase NagD (HAD superfamily)
MLKRFPYIVTDIDGVLLRGRKEIPRTKTALETIKRLNIPLCCLTNGGGSTEQVKADKCNAIFKF